eukprot:935220-Alexandrium_andersonii.AAC.1
MAEMFSPPRVAAMAERRPRYGVPPAGVFDFRPGPGGASWDFDRPEGCDHIIRSLGAQKPYVVVGGPLCTDWRGLLTYDSHPRVNQAE